MKNFIYIALLSFTIVSLSSCGSESKDSKGEELIDEPHVGDAWEDIDAEDLTGSGCQLVVIRSNLEEMKNLIELDVVCEKPEDADDLKIQIDSLNKYRENVEIYLNVNQDDSNTLDYQRIVGLKRQVALRLTLKTQNESSLTRSINLFNQEMLMVQSKLIEIESLGCEFNLIDVNKGLEKELVCPDKFKSNQHMAESLFLDVKMLNFHYDALRESLLSIASIIRDSSDYSLKVSDAHYDIEAANNYVE